MIEEGVHQTEEEEAVDEWLEHNCPAVSEEERRALLDIVYGAWKNAYDTGWSDSKLIQHISEQLPERKRLHVGADDLAWGRVVLNDDVVEYMIRRGWAERREQLHATKAFEAFLRGLSLATEDLGEQHD